MFGESHASSSSTKRGKKGYGFARKKLFHRVQTEFKVTKLYLSIINVSYHNIQSLRLTYICVIYYIVYVKDNTYLVKMNISGYAKYTRKIKFKNTILLMKFDTFYLMF